ncbi:hypothetical protein DFP73DRAFT_618440 [Morchella snyderi]|nr:hypothetical protein DFP73DRAFT_618440 [Morchella snyderi]
MSHPHVVTPRQGGAPRPLQPRAQCACVTTQPAHFLQPPSNEAKRQVADQETITIVVERTAQETDRIKAEVEKTTNETERRRATAPSVAVASTNVTVRPTPQFRISRSPLPRLLYPRYPWRRPKSLDSTSDTKAKKIAEALGEWNSPSVVEYTVAGWHGSGTAARRHLYSWIGQGTSRTSP